MEFLMGVTDAIMAMDPSWTGDRVKTISRSAMVQIRFKRDFLGFDGTLLDQ
jgi:hypothetical protein